MDIADQQTLSVLMTALYVAKWDSDDNARVRELSGSPHFAKLFNDVADELIRLDSAGKITSDKWDRWRTIEGRPHLLEKTRARIRALRLWQSWSREQKLQMVEYLLSPFTATQATLEELIAFSPPVDPDPA